MNILIVDNINYRGVDMRSVHMADIVLCKIYSDNFGFPFYYVQKNRHGPMDWMLHKNDLLKFIECPNFEYNNGKPVET